MTTPTWTPWGQPQYCEANIRGCSSAGGDWRVFMRRVADDASRVVLMREYPAQQFYAAEDVEALPVCD